MSQFLPQGRIDRRGVLALLSALPALAAFPFTHRSVRLAPGSDEIVEIGGWILKRSDLA
jgi:hypothetical protein